MNKLEPNNVTLSNRIFNRFMKKLPKDMSFMKPILAEIKEHKHENYAEGIDEQGRNYQYCIDCVEKLTQTLKKGIT